MVEKKQDWAIYEAGRAIVACALGVPFEQASIHPDRPGVTLPWPADETTAEEQLKQMIMVGLARGAAEAMRSTHGPLAVEVVTEDYGLIAPYIDALLAAGTTGERPGARDLLVLSLWERTLKLLNTHWASVTLLADLLLELGTVAYSEVDELYKHTTRWHNPT